MASKVIERVQGVNVHKAHCDEYGSGRMWVRVMSERHAMRVASLLGWHSYSGGVGRPYARLEYNEYCKTLVLSYGWDC